MSAWGKGTEEKKVLSLTQIMEEEKKAEKTVAFGEEIEENFNPSNILMKFKVKEPNCIIPNLYISSYTSARDLDLLKALHITHVVVAGNGLRPHFKDSIKYLHIVIEDWIGEDILSHFDNTFEFIEEGRQKGGVLVHCLAGVSRSSSICIAYLMKKKYLFF